MEETSLSIRREEPQEARQVGFTLMTKKQTLAQIRKELEDMTSGRKPFAERMELAFLMLELVKHMENRDGH